MAKDGVLFTPSSRGLEGMTRRTVFELCEMESFECHETIISPKTLLSADEVFLSSTAGGLIPVTRLDDVPVNSGSVGEMPLQLNQSYWDKRHEGWLGTPLHDEN